MNTAEQPLPRICSHAAATAAAAASIAAIGMGLLVGMHTMGLCARVIGTSAFQGGNASMHTA